MPDPIDVYDAKFPREVVDGIEGLADKRKRAIFALLYDNPGLSFTEIQNQLSGDSVLASETLSTSLERLKRTGLVNKQIRGPNDDTPFTSAYSVSKFGEMFFKSTLTALEPTGGPYRPDAFVELDQATEEMRRLATQNA